jgi:signal transduction histidine kinase
MTSAGSERDPRRRVGERSTAYRRTLGAAVVGLVLTVTVAVVPTVRFAYRNADGRLVLETLAAFVAALVAVLFYGRFRRTGSLQALLLVYSMGLLGFAALALVALPIFGGASAGVTTATWGALVVRQLAAFLLLAAALLPDRVVSSRHMPRETLTVVGLLVAVVVLVQVLSTQLPPAVATGAPPEESAVPSFDAHPFVLAVQAANLVCFAAAAVVFTRQSARSGDDLAGWVGAAAALGAWARANYLLYPSLYSAWFYTGDLLRLGFYVLLLVAAWREINQYWSAQTEAAVFGERRRIARELHDGTLQELGYIRSQAAGLEGPAAERIRSATERALDETRAALEALTSGGDEPFVEMLRRSVEEVADRHDVAVRCSLDATADVPKRHHQDVLRIAREAVANAARHGHARCVELRLAAGEMVLADDGKGFDTSGPPRSGAFGLVSMRDRAAGMGGEVEIESTPGQGTEVRVTWPMSS